MKTCAVCGREFEPRASFHRMCLDCWRRDHERSIYDEGYRSGFEDGLRSGKTSVTAFDNDFLLDVIKLTHPDRHPPERSTLANHITAKLNAMRKGATHA